MTSATTRTTSNSDVPMNSRKRSWCMCCLLARKAARPPRAAFKGREVGRAGVYLLGLLIRPARRLGQHRGFVHPGRTLLEFAYAGPDTLRQLRQTRAAEDEKHNAEEEQHLRHAQPC